MHDEAEKTWDACTPSVQQQGGDTIKYFFTYKNFPDGLAAVKDAEMRVDTQRRWPIEFPRKSHDTPYPGGLL